MLNLSDIIKSYKKSAEYSVLSESTKRTYDSYLKAFAERIVLPTKPSTQTPVPMQIGVALQKDVASLSNVVLTFGGPQAQRMARRILILLFGWANTYGLVQDNPARKIPLPRLTAKPRSPFTVAEVKLLENSIESSEIPELFKPYLAQAVVAFHTGMRPTELDNLVWDDVGEEFINVRSAKHKEVGAVARMVRITPSVVNCIKSRRSGLVFRSVSGQKLNKDTRSDAIRFICGKVGIKPREFYNTRRGTATEMFKAGYDIAAIQHQLGHANISTTQIYIKPTMQQAASIFRGF